MLCNKQITGFIANAPDKDARQLSFTLRLMVPKTVVGFLPALVFIKQTYL